MRHWIKGGSSQLERAAIYEPSFQTSKRTESREGAALAFEKSQRKGHTLNTGWRLSKRKTMQRRHKHVATMVGISPENLLQTGILNWILFFQYFSVSFVYQLISMQNVLWNGPGQCWTAVTVRPLCNSPELTDGWCARVYICWRFIVVKMFYISNAEYNTSFWTIKSFRHGGMV